jgi:hypothetical protein
MKPALAIVQVRTLRAFPVAGSAFRGGGLVDGEPEPRSVTEDLLREERP